jgi:hypothetical protein
MAEYTGLVEGVSAALLDTYKGLPVHPRGRVFTDLAVAVADGADAISGIAVLADRQELFGPVASMPTTWGVLDRVDAEHLYRVRSPGRAGPGPGVAAAAGASPAGRGGWSAAVGPLGLGRGDPCVRRRLHPAGGGFLVRVPGR